MTQNRNITNNDLKELQATWKKMLTSRMEENVLLKNMITDILRNNYNQNCLEEIEEFQTKFIQEDGKTNILRKQTIDLDNLLYSKTIEDGIIRESFEKVMKNYVMILCIPKTAFAF